MPPYYDSMVAKLIAYGEDRAQAVELTLRALDDFMVEGIHTTIPLHRAVVATPAFRQGQVTTRWLENEFLPSWKPAT